MQGRNRKKRRIFNQAWKNLEKPPAAIAKARGLWYPESGKNCKRGCAMKVVKILLALLLAAMILGGCTDNSAPAETTEASVATTAPQATVSWEENILMRNAADYHDYLYLDWSDDVDQSLVFGSRYQRRQIRSVTFLDSLRETGEDAWDVSAAGNGAVLAWVKPNGELYDLYIGAEGGINAGESCARMFAGYVSLEEIHFGNAFHTEQTVDMSAMFFGCHGLTELDLSGLDTGNTENMNAMLAFCSALRELELNGLNTGKVRNMENLFSGCTSLRKLDLTCLDVGNVESMYRMFADCTSLEDLDLRGLNTGRVRNMVEMFCNCCSLIYLELEGIDTRYVDNMAAMFQNCSSLRRLDLSGLDTSLVTLMKDMFRGCSALAELDISSFDTGNVTDMGYMFMDCVSLNALDLSHFDMSNVSGEYCTYMMFANCPAGSQWQHLLK
jgi:surface protein